MIPSLGWVDDVPGRGTLVRLVGGVFDGYEVLLVGPHPYAPGIGPGSPAGPTSARRRPREAEARMAGSSASRQAAGQLLESLLSEAQLADWRRRGGFWVSTPYGPVRLGKLYDLRHVPVPGSHRSVCVVPRDHKTLPVEDVWTNLLLALQADPEHFFRVARVNWEAPLPPAAYQAEVSFVAATGP